MQNSKPSRRQVNKDKVLKAALKSFIEKGIENSKISDIASLAGVTERSAFRYFSSKAELVLETALLFWENVQNHVEENYILHENDKLNGLSLINLVITQYLNLYFTSKKEIIFVQEAEVYLNRWGMDEYLINKPPIRFEKSHGPLARAIEKGIKDGSVKNDETLSELYYNTYDSVLGLLQKMSLDTSLKNEVIAKKRLLLFANALTSMYAN